MDVVLPGLPAKVEMFLVMAQLALRGSFVSFFRFSCPV